ncbi:MBL fold metallo-hydrolase [Niveispirillum sp.]|uniref:MBL fold metallo-hydrolase n=1 Tax=Niveispirillum sp. TaxID=1917217 RepID=UPI001B6C6C4E|nr:MBL fold metallo-hydrolase [Niveispirillum sp.]MBP7340578.1 MBL fold metallo-hydrolase [Niveispirillum sp.]
MEFKVKFWGVRGTFPCAYASHLTYGGNTSCVEVTAGDRTLILDAGTGLRALGKRFLRDKVRNATLLLSHAHWDHINGFPFFEPGYWPEFNLDIFARDLSGCSCIGEVLTTCMEKPLFPVPLTTMRAKMAFQNLQAGDQLDLGPGLVVKTGELNHPGGAVGYRIEYGGKSFCYVTDTEHVAGRLDEKILRLIEGADVVLYDTTYTDEEYATRVGWGHSTWSEGVKLVREAGAKRLCLFHHDPDHDDNAMAAIERDAMRAFPGAFAAREGTVLDMLNLLPVEAAVAAE